MYSTGVRAKDAHFGEKFIQMIKSLSSWLDSCKVVT
jgi:hypothetical protein